MCVPIAADLIFTMPRCSLASAEQYIRSGDAQSASDCLAQLPPSAQSAYLQGGLLTLSGNARSAILLFQKAVQAAPRHADAYFELGNALLEQREHAKAEVAFLSALKIEPRRTLCYLNLGNVYSDQGDVKRAERAFRKALKLGPSGWDQCASSNGLSNLLEARGREAEAEHVSAAALAKGGVAGDDCVYAAHNLGRLLRQRGQHAEAVALARRALAGAPTQAEFRAGLGAALHSAARYGEAIQIYRRSLAAAPTDRMLWADTANALHSAGREAESVDAYATALPLQLAHAAATLRHPSDIPSYAGGMRAPRSSRRGVRRVVFYCRLRAYSGAKSVNDDIWGPTTLARRGLGGSEEAVVYVSRELARRGWDVAVYANPPAEDLERDEEAAMGSRNPKFGAASRQGSDDSSRVAAKGVEAGRVVWRPWHSISASEREGAGVDVLVSWRNVEGALLLPKASRRYVWLQDIVDEPAAYHPALVARLDGVLILSAFHARGLPSAASHLAVLTSNGIDEATLVPPGPNEHWRFMYAAWPTAGLQPLLERWPSIRKRIRQSELGAGWSKDLGGSAEGPVLAVYYGFPAWLEQQNSGQAWYKPWRSHMERLLTQPGIEYHGMVNQSTVAKGEKCAKCASCRHHMPRLSPILLSFRSTRRTPWVLSADVASVLYLACFAQLMRGVGSMSFLRISLRRAASI